MSEPSRPLLAPGIAAGLLFSLPVALRCVPGWPLAAGGVPSERPLQAALLLVAAVSLVVVPIGLWIRGSALKDAASFDRALLHGAALSSLPLALFGSVLKSSTHHRPLGGATFAVVALLVLGLSILLSHRVGAARIPWLRHFFSGSCGLSLAGTAAFAAGRAHTLADFLTLAAACAAAGLFEIPKAFERLPGWAPVATWAVLVGASLWVLEPGLVRALQAGAPISFGALSWLGDGS